MPSAKRTARLRPHPRPAPPHPVAVFTAVDGSLLDPRTFDPGANRAAIGRLHQAGIPVVPMSVMTLEEILPVVSDLGLRHAMTVEAGGAIARWSGREWEVEPCGPPADTMLDVIRDIEDRCGARLLVYSAMADEDAARLSGRSGPMLQASTRRQFSEPFVIESGHFDAVARAATEIGFSVRRGRRFLHLCRECDEGEAFSRIREELRCETAIAVGGSAVDAEFLSRAEIPIIIPAVDGEPDAELMRRVPHAWIAPAPAPDGWAAAVGNAVESVVRGTARRRVRRSAT